MKSKFQLIETQSNLESIARKLAGEKAIAVDLESDSMYHFREKVCLLQIASKSASYIIDPLKITDLSPLCDIFSSKRIKKIFHGADYDIRSLFRDFHFEVHNLFDTQLASRFLGYEETGLEALLQRFFNISLNKHYQKKDWSQRPLPAEMMDYAAKDVVYLIPLANTLQKDLKKLNRQHWVKEECWLLSQVRPPMNNNNPLYLNFKGAGTLAGKDLAVLEAILQVRKKFAEKKDKPLFKIFQNNAIMRMVRFKPQSQKRLAQINALSPSQIEMYGNSIIKSLRGAQKTAPENFPKYPKKEPLNFKLKDQLRIRALKEWKEEKSRQLNMDPGLILARPVLGVIAVCNPKSLAQLKRINEIRSWQMKAFGEEILSSLKNMN